MPSYVFSIQNSIYHIVENYGTYYINAGTMAFELLMMIM